MPMSITTTAPVVYRTWPKLANAWALRDDQYARLVLPLAEETIAAIREGRKREVWFLPPGQRAYAWGQVQAWYPPENGR